MKRLHNFFPFALLALLCLTHSGCIKKMAVNSLADSLASGASKALATDDDLLLVGDALPFALKLMEIFKEQAPDSVGLHEALAAGFVQYGMVFVQFPAEQNKYDDFAAYRAGLDRARKLFQRANGYAMTGMELLHPGFEARLEADPQAALAGTTAEDVGMLYWLGASWLATISNSRESPELIGDLPVATAIIDRCLELDEDWGDGSIHELLISLETSRPMPGGLDRARSHYDRVIELSGGVKASPYISLATATCIKTQDREQFEQLLLRALEVDVDASPDNRLANTYAQAKARFLLDHLDDLFLGDEF